jgi:aminopeptidase N
VERPIVDRHYAEEMSMFDGRAYPKGAFVLHMLRQRLGDDVFFAGLKRYLTDNRLKSVETVDFRRPMERTSGRDLERFFYDWTERAGHPKLEVTTTYDPEHKRVRVAVKQTQAGEAFRFPLKICLKGDQAQGTSVFEELIDQKEQSIQIPMATRPRGVEIDPFQGVLAEIKEDKARDWWAWQLAAGSTAVSRVVAADHFGKSKAAEDRELLAESLAKEKSRGVAIQIMSALAESGGDVARDALLGALKNPEPRLRKAAAASLSRFGKDEKIANAALAVLDAGDPSLGVEAAAMSIYAKQQRPDSFKVLARWLEKPSNRDELRTAALNGLATTEDPAALDILIEHAKGGKSLRVRSSAISSLGRLAKAPTLSDAQRTLAVRSVTDALSDESPRIRRMAIFSLQGLGADAKSSLKVLDEVASHDPVESNAEAAKKAAAAIRTPQGGGSEEVNKLREDLERLKKEQEELRKRLEKQDKPEKKAP